MFRNSSSYIERYFAQARALADLLIECGDSLRLALVWGDSTDATESMLRDGIRAGIESGHFHPDSSPVERSHGKRHWGSVDDPERWKALTFVCDGVLAQIQPGDEALIYVESDLLWTAETMLRMRLHLYEVDAVAPLCFTSQDRTATGPRGFFYDIWGHIGMDGAQFASAPPHHPSAPTFDETGEAPLVPIRSAGSCVVVGGPVMDRIRSGDTRFGETDCIRGYCRSLGSQLWLDPGAEVRHP